MLSVRSKMEVKDELKKLGLHFVFVDMGVVEVMEDLNPTQLQALKDALLSIGLELMEDKKAILIDRIKHVVIEMIQNSEEAANLNFSHYLSEKLGQNYAYLSSLFSEVQGMTIAQYVILNKIEKVKELIIYDELNLTQISFQLNYSSVAHLSNQFRKVTGLTPSQFKNLKNKTRISIEEIGN
jgi:AraC-like DNA-binding protein